MYIFYCNITKSLTKEYLTLMTKEVGSKIHFIQPNLWEKEVSYILYTKIIFNNPIKAAFWDF